MWKKFSAAAGLKEIWEERKKIPRVKISLIFAGKTMWKSKIQMKNRDKNGIADEQCGALRDIALVSMWAELKIAAKI